MITEHLGKHRQNWRDILLGVNEGLISTFLVVAGVAGGGLDWRSILLTAIAGPLPWVLANLWPPNPKMNSCKEKSGTDSSHSLS